MKTIIAIMLVLALSGCADLKVAADIIDIFVPDDSCNASIEASVEKAVINGIIVYRVSIPGESPIYEFDKLTALRTAARMETEFQENCKNKKATERLGKQDDALRTITKDKVKPIWEKIK
jgi:N-glycosylase/DNA lyase